MAHREYQRLSIPLSNSNGAVATAEMRVPRVMTEAEWRQLHRVLRRMKPALVTPTENRES